MDLTPDTNRQPCGSNHGVHLIGTLMTSKIAYDDIKEGFLAQEWNSFHLN